MIELTGITKTYKLGGQVVHALANVDLTIEEKEFVAVMGRSGSGKSTLLNILGCMDRPTSGKYALAGRNVSELDDDALSHIRNKHIGFIFQSFHLLPRLTALENVQLPLRYSDTDRPLGEDAAERLLHRVGLQDRMQHRPNEMSGGQRQRIAVARALVNQPTVILADEPTGNLDSTTADDIMNLLTRINQSGQTIVMVTHEAEVARFARRTVVMRDGTIQKDQLS